MANILACITCDRQMHRQQMARIDGDENIEKREIALSRRNNDNRGPLVVNANTRLCNNCNISIVNEIRALQDDPLALRLNVLRQTSSNTCFICGYNGNITRLSIECRVNIFLKLNIYVSENTRACANHLNDSGLLHNHLYDGLSSVNRPYRFQGNQLRSFLQGLRSVVNNMSTSKFDDENNISDRDFTSFSPITKDQFRDLFTFCDPVYDGNTFRYITKRDLLTFLCKLRQGATDDFLAAIFGYSSRQTVSIIISTVRRSLMGRFTDENIGLQAINRETYINNHVTEFANHLYNPDPNIRRAIFHVDGTYLEVEKSSNYQAARQSFSMQKKYYLIKPALIVAPNGYILDIHGPYFSDNANNDAAILLVEIQKEGENSFNEWFQEGDIAVVDRGYRDVKDLLEERGMTVKMPPLLGNNQKQYTTEQANAARLIIKTRWIVESRNGHLKSIFKFFNNVISINHAKNLREFLKISAAIINKYKELIYMAGADAQYAQNLKNRALNPNTMQARVEVDPTLKSRNAGWIRLDQDALPDFPQLTLEYLENLTAGVYQLGLAPAYVQDKIIRDEEDSFQFDQRLLEPGLIRIRLYSRFSRRTKHQLWIAYAAVVEDEEVDVEDGRILSYYCTCKAGARTLGSCAHVAAVLWYLGYARHQVNVAYPSTILLDYIENARIIEED